VEFEGLEDGHVHAPAVVCELALLFRHISGGFNLLVWGGNTQCPCVSSDLSSECHPAFLSRLLKQLVILLLWISKWYLPVLISHVYPTGVCASTVRLPSTPFVNRT